MIAVGADGQVNSELFLVWFGEGTIEKKVDGAFYIVTKHRCFSFLVSW